jgi:tetratricopeptide (TPR) repeat protein
LGIAREKRDRIRSIVEDARRFEESGDFNGALARWEVLRKVYPRYPGLSFEIERLSRRRDEAGRTEALARWQDQIDRCLRADDCERALHLCQSALREFPDEQSFKDGEVQARQGIEIASVAQKRLEEAEAWITQGRDDEGLAALRSALEIPVRSSLVRVHLVDLLAREALLLIDKDWQTADYLVNEALKLDPAHGPSRSLLPIIDDHRKSKFVADCFTKARQLEAQGDVRSAVEAARSAVDTYPKSVKLLQLLQELQGKLIATVRPGAISELLSLLETAKAERHKGRMRELMERARAAAASYPGDSEMLEILAEMEECARQLNRPLVDRLKSGAAELRGRVSVFLSRDWAGSWTRAWSSATAKLGRQTVPVPSPWLLAGVLAAIVLVLTVAVTMRKRRPVVTTLPIAKVTPPITQTPDPIQPKTTPTPPSLPSLKVRLVTDAANPVAWLDDKPFTAELTAEIAPSADTTALRHNFRVSNGPTEVSYDLNYDPTSWPGGITRPRVNGPRVYVVGAFRGKLRAHSSIPAPILIRNRPQPVKASGLDLELEGDEQILQLTEDKTQIAIRPDDAMLVIGVFWQQVTTETSSHAMMNQAESLMSRRQYRQADEIIGKVLTRDPGNERAKRIKHELEIIKRVTSW